MPNENYCESCEKKLTNKRSHARTCGSTCRGRAWRASILKTVSVKLVLSLPQLTQLKNEASSLGLLLNELMIAKSLQPGHGSITL